MFKHLLNGSSLLALALRDANNENGAPDPKAKLREELSKGNVQNEDVNASADEQEQEDNEDEQEEKENEEDEESEEDADAVKDPPDNETEEEKKAREAREKEEAKLQRKQDRMQRRIDKAIAEKKAAEAEVKRLKEQLEANPDQKLTAEEIEAQAEAKAAKKLAEKEMADLQAKFDKDCEALAKAANKIDNQFDDKINELAEDLGPIPSFMIGILADMDNGGEVLAHIANDDELAEDIWSAKPAKMTRKLVEISNSLIEAKKPPKKQISKVPAIEPVKTNKRISNTITEADTKNMDEYVRKRQAQMAEQRKLKFG